LRAIPFNDTKRILTIFMPEEGVVSMATRAFSPTLSHLMSATSPLTCSEFIFRRGRGDVYRLLEANTLADYLTLRTNANRLDCAGEIVQILLKSQLPGKPAPLLYDLTKAYIDHLQHCSHPDNLLASFYLKLFKHEGLLHWAAHCAVCTEHPVSFFCKGQGTCTQHRNYPAHPLTSQEWQLIGLLADSRSFQILEGLHLDSSMMSHLRRFFSELL